MSDISKKANFCLFSISRFYESDVIQSLDFCIPSFFYLKSNCIGIISAEISIFDDLMIFCDVILNEMESQKSFLTGNDMICDIIHYAVTPLSDLAANILAMLST